MSYSYMWGHTDFLMSNWHLDFVSACKITFANQSTRCTCTLGWLKAGIFKSPVTFAIWHNRLITCLLMMQMHSMKPNSEDNRAELELEVQPVLEHVQSAEAQSK